MSTEIRQGKQYVVPDGGWKHSHLSGKRVTALGDAGPGFFQNSYVDVRCHCCQETFENVDYSRLS